MTFSLTHAFVSAVADGGDTSLVRPTNWNAEHTITLATDRLLGRDTAGSGAVEEISLTNGLEFTGSTSIGIANDAVTYARMQNAASAGYIGATGAGDYAHRTFANVLSDIGALPLAGGTLAGNLRFTDNTYDIGASGATRPRNIFLSGGVTHGSATLLTTTTALTNGAAAAAGTLLNAPAAGNPTKWIPINDNGTTRYIPAW